MRFYQYLNEEYAGRFTGKLWGKVTEEIFVNPSAKELKSIGGGHPEEIRFIVDFKKKKLYVWRSTIVHMDAAEWLHSEGLTKYGDMGNPIFWNNYFAGTGYTTAGGKIKYACVSDWLNSNHELANGAKWLEANNKWLDRWFTQSFTDIIKYDEVLSRLPIPDYKYDAVWK